MQTPVFKHAIVRLPAGNFATGLTSAAFGIPDYQLAIHQHGFYCQALIDCGLDLTRLDPDERFPDSTFVEDTAVLAGDLAVMANPGAPSRSGEVALIDETIASFFDRISRIVPPGTLDGGDICEAGGHFFIGVSQRTNLLGARQLADVLQVTGFSASFIDITKIPGILHLKSGLAYLGDNHLVVVDSLVHHPAFQKYKIIRVDPSEEYAANCVRVNDYVLLPTGYPRLHERLEREGFQLILLDVSEFRKMDGGLSCLSLRF